MQKVKVKKGAKTSKTGPKPEIVKIEGNWENAVWKALKKERPKDGWPKTDKESKS